MKSLIGELVFRGWALQEEQGGSKRRGRREDEQDDAPRVASLTGSEMETRNTVGTLYKPLYATIIIINTIII
eukprot:6799869-Pyramimonas_sp.AAC.1